MNKLLGVTVLLRSGNSKVVRSLCKDAWSHLNFQNTWITHHLVSGDEPNQECFQNEASLASLLEFVSFISIWGSSGWVGTCTGATVGLSLKKTFRITYL